MSNVDIHKQIGESEINKTEIARWMDTKSSEAINTLNYLNIYSNMLIYDFSHHVTHTNSFLNFQNNLNKQ